MDDLHIDDLVIHVDPSAPAFLRLDWLGASNAANPAQAIVPFFERALAEAGAGGRSVDMHLEKLEYFNSATIATLIQLIHLAGKAKVALRIYYAGQLRWQAVSLEALEQAVRSFRGKRSNVEFFPARS